MLEKREASDPIPIANAATPNDPGPVLISVVAGVPTIA